MKTNRLYCFLLLVGVLGMFSCSSDDPLTDEEKAVLGRKNVMGAFYANGEPAPGGYETRLLAPPGFERGVGYTYATGAEYLEGVAFNIFNLNYLDSIQILPIVRNRLLPPRHAVPCRSNWHCRQVLASTSSWLTSASQVTTPREVYRRASRCLL